MGRHGAATRPGHTDREKRERIREAARAALPRVPPEVIQWAFRILVRKSGARRFDIENVPKLITDAFCRRQILEDRSAFSQLALYEDDAIDHVIGLQITGERTNGPEMTIVEIFGHQTAGSNQPAGRRAHAPDGAEHHLGETDSSAPS